jgi:hypothetical protein
VQALAKQKAPVSGAFAEPSSGLEPETPPDHGGSGAELAATAGHSRSSFSRKSPLRGVLAREGTFACFPPGIAHTFLNESDHVVRVLNINAPGGWEQVLRTLATKSSGEHLSQEEIGRVAAERDMIIID